ncbi:MAG: DUF1638 domain-containing protein [Candidatus Latescibacteria bacterium]|nr:DUF1638 domain-containing protein [Candidatus Latescibacterota bacterium]
MNELRKTVPNDVELIEVWLEQGLHREPAKLNKLVKNEIVSTEANNEQFDAILLGYGICSRGTIGVKSNRYRIVVPRAHDCITMFLGSKERYLDEFSKAPGTYWFTPGFMSGKMQPGMSEKYAGIYHQFEENYEEYLEKFGDEESARFVIDHQEQAWIKNYSRGAYVKSGLPGGEALKKKAVAFCSNRNWTFEEVQGDFTLIRDLISGNWDPDRFLVLEPGQTLIVGGINDIINAQGTEKESLDFRDDYQKSFVYDGNYREIRPDEPFNLSGDTDRVIGIDAGGTYTDAVVISLKKHTVLATAKAPTTYHDLSIGIRKAVLELPGDLVKTANRLAISTTLATNAIVEGKGGRTGVILIGYDESTSSKISIGAGDLKAVIPGLHDIYGVEIQPLDEYKLVETANKMIEKGVEALAVSSYMGTRNPNHEVRALSILRDRFSVPVVTGHDLTDDIDSVRRAMTALLNARLLPVIDRLVDSIKRVVEDLELPVDIRLVTTEGSLMNTVEAKQAPVRMLLSGPAASVAGVRFLTDVDSCVLIDMGGTTSDIAVIEGGSARRTGRGATVGQYKTSIHATDIRTLGLGGDSRTAWEHERVTVGPKRVVPICVLATEYQNIIEHLEELKGYSGTDYGLVQPGTFYVIHRMPSNISFLNEREQRILHLLEKGPLSEVQLAERLDYPYVSLLGTERLEKTGIILASGLTPTDIVSAEGNFKIWDKKAAEILLSLFSERSGLSISEFIEQVRTEILRLASSEIITETLSGNGDESFPGCQYCRDTFGVNGPIEVSYRLKTSLVGIGAPTHHLIKGMGKFLTATTIFPEHGEVANAIGAASGAGGMHIDMGVIPDTKGRFLLYSPDGKFVFGSLNDAKTEALRLSREHARIYAGRMGYERFRLDVRVKDRSAPTANSGEIYIDTSIVARMRY